METLVVAHHRNHDQYHGRNCSHGSTRFGSSSPPSGGYRGINCRTFHSGEGMLWVPIKSCPTKTSVTNNALCSSLSPKTPSPPLNGNSKTSKRFAKSSSILIPMNIMFENKEGGLQFSELWAGPAYSNSPPPSSLPMPKFSMRPKRTVSLDLPTAASKVDLPPFSNSAPPSPRERSCSPGDLFDNAASPRECSPSPGDLFDIADSATKTLRRLLNLDISDE